jgi:hypothetical protein
MQKIKSRLFFSLCISAILFSLTIACSEDNLSPEESKAKTEVAASDNSEILASTQEVLDLTSIALTEKGVSNGRISASGRLAEHGFNCYPTIRATYDVKKTADSVVYTGTIVIDFGDGAACEDSSKVRSGKITDEFKMVVAYHDSIPLKSTEIITFEGYQKDSVKLDGILTSTYSSGGLYVVDFDDTALTYEDGTTVTWNGTLNYAYNDSGTRHWKDDTKTLTGSISGTTREGDDFDAEISEEISFSYECEGKHDVPVSGTIHITVSGATSEVDYGDGTCDKVYIITANGETTEYTFGKQNT